MTSTELVAEATDAQVERAGWLLLFVPDPNHQHHTRQQPRMLHLAECQHNYASVEAPWPLVATLRGKGALCKDCVFTATLYVVADAYTRLLEAID